MSDAAGAARARTLDYFRTRAAELDAPRIRARVRSAAAELEATLAGLAQMDARRPVWPGEWTVAQVVDHIAQSTVRAAEELRHLLAGHRPPGPPVYEGLLSGASHRVPWSELIQGLREASAALDAVLVEAARHPLLDGGAAGHGAHDPRGRATGSGERAGAIRRRAQLEGVRLGPAGPLPGSPGADPATSRGAHHSVLKAPPAVPATARRPRRASTRAACRSTGRSPDRRTSR